jgi:hypothetical protein
MKVDIYLSVFGHDEVVTPEHQIVSIDRESSKTVSFWVHTNGAYSYSRVSPIMNLDGVYIESPIYFDNYYTNDEGFVIDYDSSIEIKVTLTTSTFLPKDTQVAYIEYKS